MLTFVTAGLLWLAIFLNLYSALTYYKARRRVEANAAKLERDYQIIRADVQERIQHLIREFMADPNDPRWWQDSGQQVH